jgi:sRNA-binding regulator protein Hfq
MDSGAMDTGAKLIDLAKEKFGQLTEAETKLFESAAIGEPADCSASDEKDNDPANAANWPKARTIRAKCITWLCTKPKALALVTHKGIQVRGTRIDGEIDLKFARIPFPLYFDKCAFPELINLQNAKIPALNLAGTHTGPIKADSLKVDGSVFLRNGFMAEGEVRLLIATIGGNLECSNSQFNNKDKIALNGDGLEVEGTVFLNNGFKAEGEVHLLSATIGGNLDCISSQFINKGKRALSADRLKVDGAVFLRDGFKAEGEVRLLGAIIRVDLDCEKAQFINPNGYALNADGMNVDGVVFMKDGFKAQGEVRLPGAIIGGDLDCSGNPESGIKGGQFINKGKTALNANGIKVEGSVYLSYGFEAEGEVRFVGAAIGINLECDKSQFNNPNGNALNVDGLTVEGNVFLRNGFKGEGEVNLIGATIGRYFVWTGVESPEKVTLDLRSAKIGTLWDDERSWPKPGELLLDGLVYEKLFETAPQDADTRIKWLRLQPKDPFLPQPYEQLADVLWNMGKDAEAKKILIAKNKDRVKWGLKLTLPEWCWYRNLGPMIGFGYQPTKALSFILIFISFGWLLFGIGYWDGQVTPPSDSAYVKLNHNISVNSQDRQLLDVYPKFNFLVYSIDSFVPLVDLHQAKYWLPNANQGPELFTIAKLPVRTGGLLRLYLWIHTSMGWILSTLFVAGLSKLPMVRT